jgi:hypothetical protein
MLKTHNMFALSQYPKIPLSHTSATMSTTQTASLPNAFVTLLNSSSYLPGALVLCHALNDLHPQPREIDFQTVCIVTPETVDVGSIKQLRQAFDVVIGVEVITSGTEGEDGLNLMGMLQMLSDDSMLMCLCLSRST